jgi:putative toxin-antitoxin system antitoxin component (TIGR02293 family)
MRYRVAQRSNPMAPLAYLSRPAARIDLYRATPAERVEMIRAGLAADDAKRILAGFSIPQGRLTAALGLAVATLNRRAAQGQRLSLSESERVMGLARLIGQVEAMVEETGADHGFDSRAWLSRWLDEPVAALGGVAPLDLLDTVEGQGLVSDTLARIRSGAYA